MHYDWKKKVYVRYIQDVVVMQTLISYHLLLNKRLGVLRMKMSVVATCPPF